MTLSYTIRLILSILLYGKEKKKIYENHTSSCYPEKGGPPFLGAGCYNTDIGEPISPQESVIV